MKIYRITDPLWGGGFIDIIMSASSPEEAKKVASSYKSLQYDLSYYTKDFDTLFDNSKVVELGTYNKDVAEVIAYGLSYANCY